MFYNFLEESIRQRINHWVREATQGRVTELLEPMVFKQNLETLTQMWIVNSKMYHQIDQKTVKLFKNMFIHF